MLKKTIVTKNFITNQDVEMNFLEITSINEFWEFSDSILLRAIIYDENSGNMRILNENFVIGTLRLRQLKVRNDSCKIDKTFAHLYKECFGEYSSENEDHAKYGYGTALNFASSDQIDGFWTFGKFHFYSGGGYYQDLQFSRDKNRLMLNNLYSSGWINKGTRAVFVEFTIYNENIKSFCSVKWVIKIKKNLC
jgi:hypothetical protein